MSVDPKEKGVQGELSQDSGAEETGQPCVGLHKSPGQQGDQTRGAEFLTGDGVVLLDDGEHVQSKPATHGDLELVQVREPRLKAICEVFRFFFSASLGRTN